MSSASPFLPSTQLNEEFILESWPKGAVTESVFQKRAVAFPSTEQLKEGEVILKLLFTSVDPYMRWVIRDDVLGSVRVAYSVAEVIASHSSNWPIGEMLFDYLPWRRYTIHSIDTSESAIRVDKSILSSVKLSPSVYLSALGMVSRTAFFGCRDVLKINSETAKKSESNGLTVLVSGAAGGTGTFVVQMARLFGATRVIGVAGGKDKCDYVVKELGADACLDYKQYSTVAAIRSRLQELAPNGIDRYFDNTGGPVTSAVFDLTNPFARIAICGAISQINSTDVDDYLVPTMLHKLVFKSVTIKGFTQLNFVQKYPEFYAQAAQWLKEGKLKDKQYMVEGFDNIPKAFVELFQGSPIGKTIIRVA